MISSASLGHIENVNFLKILPLQPDFEFLIPIEDGVIRTEYESSLKPKCFACENGMEESHHLMGDTITIFCMENKRILAKNYESYTLG